MKPIGEKLKRIRVDADSLKNPSLLLFKMRAISLNLSKCSKAVLVSPKRRTAPIFPPIFFYININL